MLYENNYFHAIQNNLIMAKVYFSYVQTVIMSKFDTFNFDFIQINANIVIIISLSNL